MLLLCQTAFSQSKKEQIEILIFQKDSLVRVLEKERMHYDNQLKKLDARNIIIKDSLVNLVKKERQTGNERIMQLEAALSSQKGKINLAHTQIDSLKSELEGLTNSYFFKEKKLHSEIKKIKNSEMLLQFLANHAAKYEDFDSLYFIIHGDQPPKNLTYNYTNGIGFDENEIKNSSDSRGYNLTYKLTGNVIEIDNYFRWILETNFRQFSFDKDNSIYSSEYFKRKADPYTDYSNSLEKLIPIIKNEIALDLDSLEVDSFAINLDDFKTGIQINPMRRVEEIRTSINRGNWGESYKSEFKNDLVLSSKNKIVFYIVSDRRESVSRWKDKFRNTDPNWSSNWSRDKFYLPLVNDLGGGIIAENIASFIGAQVFHDIVFFEINGRVVWFNFHK